MGLLKKGLRGGGRESAPYEVKKNERKQCKTVKQVFYKYHNQRIGHTLNKASV
jgi:hypothetical protein